MTEEGDRTKAVDLSMDDLLEGETMGSAPYRPVVGGNEITITQDDLMEVEREQAFTPTSSAGYAPVSGAWGPGYAPSALAKGKQGGVTKALFNPIWQGVLFGAAGGLLAWALQEAFINGMTADTFGEMVFEVALWSALIGALIGAVLGSADGATGRVVQKALMGALLGLGVGAAGGFFSGALAQAVYGGALRSTGGSLGAQILIRGIAWALLGAGVGLSQGMQQRKARKVVNGLIGGALGGLVGGLLFDPIGMVVGGGGASRFLAIVVLGAATGGAIGAVETVRKQAWVEVVEGLLAGKQFILYGNRTTIGSSPKCDIVLPKDLNVAPIHAMIDEQAGAYYLVPAGTVVRVGEGLVQGRTRLTSGQMIHIGSSTLLYTEKRVVPPPGQQSRRYQ